MKRDLQKVFTGLYGITAEKYSLGRPTVEVARIMIEAGVKIIQYREKEKTARQKYEDCLKIRGMTRQRGVIFIVNDDADIALAVGADGVHAGQDDLPADVLRSLLGGNMIIGVSTHSPAQAYDAVARGADYIGVGPLYTTTTKENVVAAVGLEYLDFALKSVSVPLVAIGGIKRHNLSEVLERGARCAAMLTEIVGAHDIEERLREIRGTFKEHGLSK